MIELMTRPRVTNFPGGGDFFAVVLFRTALVADKKIPLRGLQVLPPAIRMEKAMGRDWVRVLDFDHQNSSIEIGVESAAAPQYGHTA